MNDSFLVEKGQLRYNTCSMFCDINNFKILLITNEKAGRE